MLKVFIVFALFNFAFGQYLQDPIITMLPKPNLVPMAGPVYVEPSSLQSALLTAYAPPVKVAEETIYTQNPYTPYSHPPQNEVFSDYVPSAPVYDSYRPVQYIHDDQPTHQTRVRIVELPRDLRQANERPKMRSLIQDPQIDRVLVLDRGQLQNDQFQAYGHGQLQNGQFQAYEIQPWRRAYGTDLSAQDFNDELKDSRPTLNSEGTAAQMSKGYYNDNSVLFDDPESDTLNDAPVRKAAKGKGYSNDQKQKTNENEHPVDPNEGNVLFDVPTRKGYQYSQDDGHVSNDIKTKNALEEVENKLREMRSKKGYAPPERK